MNEASINESQMVDAKDNTFCHALQAELVYCVGKIQQDTGKRTEMAQKSYKGDSNKNDRNAPHHS